MLNILLDILDRLRYVPGLGWLRSLYMDLNNKKMNMEIQARKMSNIKKRTETSLRQVREIPSVLKGSKKRT